MKFASKQYKKIAKIAVAFCWVSIVIGGGTACSKKTIPTTPPTYAFMTSYYDNSVTSCEIDGGNLVACTSNVIPGLNLPNGIAITNGYAFITNEGNSSVTSCTVSGAELTACTTTVLPVALNVEPWGIAISNGYAYIANNTTNGTYQIISCPVSGRNLIGTSCINSGASSPNLSKPTAIAISNGYAYIVNNDNEYLTSCVVNGPYLNCNQNDTNLNVAPVSEYDYGYGIAINNGYAVITGYYGEITCQVSDGVVSNCNNTPLTGLYESAGGVAINDGYIFFTNINYYTPSGPFSCTFDAGTLSACILTPPQIVFVQSYGIAIN